VVVELQEFKVVDILAKLIFMKNGVQKTLHNSKSAEKRRLRFEPYTGNIWTILSFKFHAWTTLDFWDIEVQRWSKF